MLLQIQNGLELHEEEFNLTAWSDTGSIELFFLCDVSQCLERKREFIPKNLNVMTFSGR